MVCNNHCDGICNNFKAKNLPNNQSRYANGQKRCQMCGIFMYYEGIFCPCCGYRLRLGRRGSSSNNVKTNAIYN